MVFEQIGGSLVNPLLALWESFVYMLPGLIAAIIVLIFGYLVAMIIGYVLEKILEKIKLDTWVMEKASLKKWIGALKLSEFLALIAKWYIFIWFLPPAAGLLSLETLASFLNKVAEWVPNIILAVLIALVGFIAAEYVGNKIVATKAKGAIFIADIAKVVILVVIALIVLEQIGVKVALVQYGFLIVLGGIMLAIALIFGIAFGLGAKEDAKVFVKQIKKKLL
jgi:hypothetical protein